MNLFKSIKPIPNSEREENEQVTYDEIYNGAVFGGYNLWILGAAMIIACIGLTMDSTSAVIGAMLISPLMGPIIGFAFGLSINDLQLKKIGIKNWLIMTLISLLSSTSFFLISPFDHSTTILLSFTKATIFDIILAFFGGIVGFIGIIKKDGTKVISGVAVATTCMPALCSAGFGLAHLNMEFFFGGLYYYIVNCFFIGWATFIVSRVFNYHVSFKSKNTITTMAKWFWSIIVIILIIPGIYLIHKKYKAEYKNNTQSDKERIEILEKKIKHLEILSQKK